MKTFGRLVVIGRCGKRVSCVCECGNTTEVNLYKLLSGHTRSCGCLRRATLSRQGGVRCVGARRTHGLSRTPEYLAFIAARLRCNSRKHPKFHDYGGRGIKFLFTSFEQFLEHIGQRPHGLTLDRIDNDGHYEPGNVRWATRSLQMYNRRTWKGESTNA